MTSSHRRSLWFSILAALIVFIAADLPIVSILLAEAAGGVGEFESAPLFMLATLGIVVSVLTGWLMLRAYRAIELDTRRGPRDVWAAFFAGMIVFLLGSVLLPFLILWMMVGDDRAPASEPSWPYIVWAGGFIFISVVAALAGGFVFGWGRRRRRLESGPARA